MSPSHCQRAGRAVAGARVPRGPRLLRQLQAREPGCRARGDAVGGAAAGLSYSLNGQLLDLLRMEFVSYSRYASPWLEEALKAALLVYLIRSRRIGMLVDAAIYGFAIGPASRWSRILLPRDAAGHPHGREFIRGFGTAMMHGGATAIFAIVSAALADKRPDSVPRRLRSRAAGGGDAALRLQSPAVSRRCWPRLGSWWCFRR